MERDGRATAKWLLEPTADGAPLSVGILGWLVLINGMRIGSQGIVSPLENGPAIVVGVCTIGIGWTILTGRPIGLAGGFLGWSLHITLGFFGVLNAGTVEDDVDLLLGIVAAATLWLTGLWILYRHRGFFLEHVATDCEPVE
ncbi:hypothetical protein C488_18990 [Natrinema pellirubrum DSM 15624]|uniref:Uncharacterized protein n=1 Tax=Natrinema pellirubrum (strain DSM 15624 / CIP 106293 / JCM 10476 / NCIMB 786 / 157) TaxID=797303 RepID=L0JGK5_NATP1|nr:hypothetical protein [Natrinema pellirubrum]AGB29988.1 hypothetical protein Natpe_0037 [Natrinema pellirubrum DSM 15624]ELY70530.1 hypothetical protein C488_18990 [Natrinema pellirubrum DSM 15624]